jgi:hypothetical protein
MEHDEQKIEMKSERERGEVGEREREERERREREEREREEKPMSELDEFELKLIGRKNHIQQSFHSAKSISVGFGVRTVQEQRAIALRSFLEFISEGKGLGLVRIQIHTPDLRPFILRMEGEAQRFHFRGADADPNIAGFAITGKYAENGFKPFAKAFAEFDVSPLLRSETSTKETSETSTKEDLSTKLKKWF